MKHKAVFFCTGVLFIFYLFIFRNWIVSDEIIGGDWPYLFYDTLHSWALSLSAWQSNQAGGLGGLSPSYFLLPYNALSAWISSAFHIPWVMFYKIFWFFLPLLSMIFGTYRLSHYYLPTFPSWVKILSGVIFVTNTYMLMIAGGGQMGVFIAISFLPWVLWAKDRTLTAGLLFGLQLSWDPRIAYLTAIAMIVLMLFQHKNMKTLIRHGFIIGIISLLINAYWILPLVILGQNPLEALGSAFTTVDALRFFSFADFSHSLSLLHPNWPDNIFGKISFLRPEFLVMPLLAFSSLLLPNRYILGFAALGLAGAFFGKGANPPFGEIYIWLFEHIPGFVMFRDPTKFYALIAISYAILIPYSLYKLNRFVKFIPVWFIIFWGFTLWPALSDNLGGTFAKRTLPSEYVGLSNFLSKEPGFFRTLWVPRQSRFAYSSNTQASVESEPFLQATDSASIVNVFTNPNTQDMLTDLGFRYVIVPADPYAELFIEDHKYSEKKRQSIIASLDSISWLTKMQDDAITVYKTPSARDLFWLSDESALVWEKVSDDKYVIDVETENQKILFMSQSFHSGWQLFTADMRIESKEAAYGTVSFLIPEGAHQVTVEFTPSRFFHIGRIISFITVSVVILLFVSLKKI